MTPLLWKLRKNREQVQGKEPMEICTEVLFVLNVIHIGRYVKLEVYIGFEKFFSEKN